MATQQETARDRVQGLMKKLTTSSGHEAVYLLEWLEKFSERLMNRADQVTVEIHKLVDSTGFVEQDLDNAFNTFRGLSSSQFVENRVYEEDETTIIKKDNQVQDQGMPSQSFENDIVPRYKEAVATAWSIYEKHIHKSYKRGSHKSRILSERWQKQLPHILGTEEFMRDNSCGLAEDRSTDMEAFESESDADRDGANMAAEMAVTGTFSEREWSDSESDVSEEQIGSFEPAVSAALNFKAMLEAALRSPYIPHNDGSLVSHGSSMEPFTSVDSTATVTSVSDQVLRNMSEGGHTALQSHPDMELHFSNGHFQNFMKDFKVVSPFTSLALRDTTEPEVSHEHRKDDKVNMPEDSGLQQERSTRNVNNLFKALPAPNMHGGLFEDENEDEIFGLQKVLLNTNSWSSPTIPQGLFGDVTSEAQKENENSELSKNHVTTAEAVQSSFHMNSPTLFQKKDSLFEYENEDEIFGLQKVLANTNSWSSPTIPKGLFGEVASEAQKENKSSVLSKNHGTISEAVQDFHMNSSTLFEKKDAHLPSAVKMVKSSLVTDGSSSRSSSYDHVHGLFSFQGSTGSGLPLKDSLLLFRKGLFDDDDDDNDRENDNVDLFGSSSHLGVAQSFKEVAGNDIFVGSKSEAEDGTVFLPLQVGQGRSVTVPFDDNVDPSASSSRLGVAQSFEEVAGNDIFAGSKGEADDGTVFLLSQVEQTSAGSRACEDISGEANDDVLHMPSHADMYSNSALVNDIRKEGKDATGIGSSDIHMNVNREDSWSSVSDWREIVSNSNSLILESEDVGITHLPKTEALHTTELPLLPGFDKEAKTQSSHLFSIRKEEIAIIESDDVVNSWSNARIVTDTLQLEDVGGKAMDALSSLMADRIYNEGRDEGMGQCQPDQINSVGSRLASKVLIDVPQESVGRHEGRTGEIIPADSVSESKRLVPDEVEVSVKLDNVSSKRSRAISLLQEHLHLHPSMLPFQAGTNASTSNLFVVNASRAGNKNHGSEDTMQLKHATMSRPRGSSKRRAPSSCKDSALSRSVVNTSSPAVYSMAIPEFVAGISEEQDQTGKGPEVEAVESEPKVQEEVGVGTLVSYSIVASSGKKDDHDKNYLLHDVSQRTDAVMHASSTSGDAFNAGEVIVPNLSMPMSKASLNEDKVGSKLLDKEHFSGSSVSAPKQGTAESSVAKSVMMKPLTTSIKSVLFGDDNDDNEASLFGPLQAGIAGTHSTLLSSASLSTNQGSGLSLFDSDEENTKSEYGVTKKGTDLKSLSQDLHRCGVGSTGSLITNARKSLFEEDDDDD